MNRLKLTSRLVLALALQLLLFHAFSVNTDTLYFLGDENYPPFEYEGENGEAKGFAVDLLEEVAQVSGLNIKLDLGAWSEVYHQLKNKEADGIVGMLRSAEREEVFSFSMSHSLLTHIMIVRPSAVILSYGDLDDKSILVLENDVMHQHLSSRNAASELIVVKTFDELFSRFNQGIADAVVVSRIHAWYFLNEHDLGKYIFVDIPIDPFACCFALQKGDTILQARINEGLHILYQNGKYNEIYNKWFGGVIEESMPGFLPTWWRILALGLVFFAAGFLIRNYFLRVQVSKKARLLQSELNAKTQAEKQLRTTVERLKVAQSSAGIGIWELNLKTMDLFWDDGMYVLYGQNKQDFNLSYEGWLATVHPDDKEVSGKIFQEAIEKNHIYDAVFRIQTAEGFTKFVRAFAKISIDKDKKSAKAIGVSWDITKAKEGETIDDVLYSISQAAIFSESLVGFMDRIRLELSRVVDTTNFFIGLMEEGSGKLYLPYMKDNVEEFKYFPVTKSISSYVINQKKSMLLNDTDLLKLHKKGVIERAGGKAKVWLGVPLRVGNQVIGLIVLQSYNKRDSITHEHTRLLEYIAPQLSLFIKRKKAQDELSKNAETLRKTAAQLKEAQIIARVGSLDWDENSKKYFFSDEIFQIFGMEKIEGLTNLNLFRDLIHPMDLDRVNHELIEARDKRERFDIECRIFSKETGEPRILIIKGKPVFVDGEITRSYSGIVQDITEQKEIEYELTRAKERAEQSDRLKSAFLANMSHEIRTPMNSIIGFTQLLTEAESPQELERYTEIISKNGEHLLKLIDEIIDISKVEAGLMKMDFNTFDVDELCDSTLHQFLENYKVKKGEIELKLNCPDAKIGLILSDKTKLRQVLTNLIFNALKFTDKGSIELAMEVDHKNQIKFCICDTGWGIPVDKIKNIFDRFMQVNTNEISKSSGAGLGLALCKSYVHLLGGKIWVESELGKGSSFYVAIPLERGVQGNDAIETNLEIPAAKPSSHTILIAEDDADSYLFLETILFKSGFNFIHALNGKEAVAACKANPEINLVLMDIRMPEMDGLAATREIKAFRKDLPVIAQTAHAMDGDREKSLEAGCNDYITKPINRDALFEKINFLLSKS